MGLQGSIDRSELEMAFVFVATVVGQHPSQVRERCDMDPIEAFGSELGEACIEVHHRDTHISDMENGHETRLEDLECLCANCHRVTHREIKARL